MGVHGRPKRFQFCASIFANLCRAARDTIALDTKYIKRITVNGIFNDIFLVGLVLNKAEISQEQPKIVCRVVARGS